MKTRNSFSVPPRDPIWGAFALSCVMLALLLVLSHLTEAPAEASDVVAPAVLEFALLPAITTWASDITTDTTWTKENSPYQVTSDITVLAGATLTVEPGVEVRFDRYAGLRVLGKLTALGTATQPITFTGQFTTPLAGWWDGISIKGSQSAPNNTGMRTPLLLLRGIETGW